ncbi:hypothetical protein BD413DRAFT_282717 [Trametes elegans]|nr:hypothetical protein BD413DRAFT_282717 [Trametes elegans]
MTSDDERRAPAATAMPSPRSLSNFQRAHANHPPHRLPPPYKFCVSCPVPASLPSSASPNKLGLGTAICSRSLAGRDPSLPAGRVRAHTRRTHNNAFGCQGLSGALPIAWPKRAQDVPSFVSEIRSGLLCGMKPCRYDGKFRHSNSGHASEACKVLISETSSTMAINGALRAPVAVQSAQQA